MKIKIYIPDELKELGPQYLKNRFQDIVTLKDALNRKDFDAIAKLSHKIKGTAGSYGFNDLGTWAKSLEIAAISRKYEECADLHTKISEHLESVEFAD